MNYSSQSKATSSKTINNTYEIKNPHKFTLKTQREYDQIISKLKLFKNQKAYQVIIFQLFNPFIEGV